MEDFNLSWREMEFVPGWPGSIPGARCTLSTIREEHGNLRSWGSSWFKGLLAGMLLLLQLGRFDYRNRSTLCLSAGPLPPSLSGSAYREEPSERSESKQRRGEMSHLSVRDTNKKALTFF
ncbi:hypothetical protein PoB_002200400 [Plakobranchus ocellatus]|uniref:Uncharacterized protein n=1 Tax=Plakobranchus ocellatus TaxID=259542 RepID=A0AAV3ZNP9_9GAST|nr:hypothetical protein PoB_002200400 [Plakobranchus ocellatus]